MARWRSPCSSLETERGACVRGERDARDVHVNRHRVCWRQQCDEIVPLGNALALPLTDEVTVVALDMGEEGEGFVADAAAAMVGCDAAVLVVRSAEEGLLMAHAGACTQASASSEPKGPQSRCRRVLLPPLPNMQLPSIRAGTDDQNCQTATTTHTLKRA